MVKGLTEKMTNIPHWPDRLTKTHEIPRSVFDAVFTLFETNVVRQIYVTHNGVGPCVMIFDENEFASWWPCLTWGRTQEAKWGL